MELSESKSIFSPATGFIRRGGFEWTCNPYIGCTFGCAYCYAAFLPQNRRPASEWGRWITAKKNAAELAAKHAPKIAGQPVYMSSVTDPYQPIERGLMLTRGILEAIVSHQPRLTIQTRGPLVARDIDVLKDFRSLRVNVSIPTDSERVRMQFEPKAPPLEKEVGRARATEGRGHRGRRVRDSDAAHRERGHVRAADRGLQTGCGGVPGLPRRRRAVRRGHRRGGAAAARRNPLGAGGLPSVREPLAAERDRVRRRSGLLPAPKQD